MSTTEYQGILLGAIGDLRVTEPIPQSLGLTSQALVRGPQPGNPPSLLLGSPPGQLHTGLCVAVKASLPFTVSVFLPWWKGPKERMGRHILVLHLVLGLALVLASQESAHPLHL